MKDELRCQQSLDDAVIAAVRKWLPPLVQILTSVACRLLLITGKNAKPVVITMWNDSVL
jgi:hypothetical protein